MNGFWLAVAARESDNVTSAHGCRVHLTKNGRLTKHTQLISLSMCRRSKVIFRRSFYFGRPENALNKTAHLNPHNVARIHSIQAVWMGIFVVIDARLRITRWSMHFRCLHSWNSWKGALTFTFFGRESTKLAPVDRFLKVLQLIYWIKVDWMNRWDTNSRIGTFRDVTFSFGGRLRPNTWLDRVGLKRCAVEQFIGYRFIFEKLKSDHKCPSCGKLTKGPLFCQV